METKVCTECKTTNSTKWCRKGTICRNCYNRLRKIDNPELVERLKKIAAKTRITNANKNKERLKEYYKQNRQQLIDKNSARAKLRHQPTKGTCNICGTSFTARKGTTCCGETCRTELNRRRSRERYVPKTHTVECSVCHQLYLNITGKHFCSSECYSKHKTMDRRRRYQEDLNFKLMSNLRSRLRLSNKSESTRDLLGCSIEEFKIYLESKFQPGMSWGNYGRKGWHIDHIRPLSWFDLTDPEQLKKACQYKNLQPLWAEENHAKGNRYSDDQQAKD